MLAAEEDRHGVGSGQPSKNCVRAGYAAGRQARQRPGSGQPSKNCIRAGCVTGKQARQRRREEPEAAKRKLKANMNSCNRPMATYGTLKYSTCAHVWYPRCMVWCTSMRYG